MVESFFFFALWLARDMNMFLGLWSSFVSDLLLLLQHYVFTQETSPPPARNARRRVQACAGGEWGSLQSRPGLNAACTRTGVQVRECQRGARLNHTIQCPQCDNKTQRDEAHISRLYELAAGLAFAVGLLCQPVQQLLRRARLSAYAVCVPVIVQSANSPPAS